MTEPETESFDRQLAQISSIIMQLNEELYNTEITLDGSFGHVSRILEGSAITFTLDADLSTRVSIIIDLDAGIVDENGLPKILRQTFDALIEDSRLTWDTCKAELRHPVDNSEFVFSIDSPNEHFEDPQSKRVHITKRGVANPMTRFRSASQGVDVLSLFLRNIASILENNKPLDNYWYTMSLKLQKLEAG